MAELVVKQSDFSGEISIKPDEEMAQVTVVEHPEMKGAARKLDVLATELEGLDKLAMKVVRLEVLMPGEEVADEYTITPANYKKLHKDGTNAVEVLNAAKPVKGKRSNGSPENGEQRNYRGLEASGARHKGLTTDQEKRMVRDHFPFINQRLIAEGDRPINPADPEHQKRYGLLNAKGDPAYFTGTLEELLEGKPQWKEDYERVLGKTEEESKTETAAPAPEQ